MNFNEGAVVKDAGNSKENKTGGWRSKKPIIIFDKCKRCGVCWMFCPDNAIHKTKAGAFEVDYDFCKGCGICARECPFKAIDMVEEEK